MIRTLRVDCADDAGNITACHHVTFDDDPLWARLVAAGHLVDADTATPSISDANWNADSPAPPPEPANNGG